MLITHNAQNAFPTQLICMLRLKLRENSTDLSLNGIDGRDLQLNNIIATNNYKRVLNYPYAEPFVNSLRLYADSPAFMVPILSFII